ncbi:hypothetical protein [Paeniglutamicibacter cryotolerans]|uniref:Leucine-rich repeat domain-containing protein n=1 Tax=Paeniglutamicibacter cryotolerans TaxID=670079 RepID=A0A839QN10_9MICC|nr:hypothetical protein [Paeniglutamicibacter cryotolerans]MBB2994602.1 hypothetical protein [Paeniglutamicibacter cryotolerans]
MLWKITALTATAASAAGALVGTSMPAQAAAKTIYTQCTADGLPQKLTKKTLSTGRYIVCTDLADLSALKGAKKLESLSLNGSKKLKITGTSKLQSLSTGPTKVTSLGNIARLKHLANLMISTTKSFNYAQLASRNQLLSLEVNTGTSTINLASVAALPKLGWFVLDGENKQSLSQLKKSKSLQLIFLSADRKVKLKKGQTYKFTAATTQKFGVATLRSTIGWKYTPKEVQLREIYRCRRGDPCRSKGKQTGKDPRDEQNIHSSAYPRENRFRQAQSRGEVHPQGTDGDGSQRHGEELQGLEHRHFQVQLPVAAQHKEHQGGDQAQLQGHQRRCRQDPAPANRLHRDRHGQNILRFHCQH